MRCYVYFIILSVSLTPIQSNINKRPKLVIDNDAGGDDSMAIFLSLLYEKYFNGPKLVALTTGNGNTNESNVYFNNQRILKHANRQDIPIYRGSKTSLVITPTTNNYYGLDGMGDTGDNFTDLPPARNQSAVLALIELSKLYKDELTVITIGTLTNIALAIKLDPDFLQRINHLYIAAGHLHGQRTPNPEFNAFMDVEAYHIVTQHANPEKVTVYPFSQTISMKLSKAWRRDVLGTINTNIMTAQNKHEQTHLRVPGEGEWNALDPAMVALVVREDLVKEYKYSENSIILCGEKRGINTNNFEDKNSSNVRMIFSVKEEEYKQFLIDVFQSGN